MQKPKKKKNQVETRTNNLIEEIQKHNGEKKPGTFKNSADNNNFPEGYMTIVNDCAKWLNFSVRIIVTGFILPIQIAGKKEVNLMSS